MEVKPVKLENTIFKLVYGHVFIDDYRKALKAVLCPYYTYCSDGYY